MIYCRHIFFHTLGSCLLSTLLFTIVLLAGNALKDVLQLLANGLAAPGFFLKNIFLLIPNVISYALPLGIVSGMLSTIGRMSTHNEILALQTAGLSLVRIAVPAFLVAFLASILSLGINLLYGPRMLHFYRENLRNLFHQTPLQLIRPHCFIRDFPHHIIFVEIRREEKLRNLYVWELNSDGKLDKFLRAENGLLNAQNSSLLLTLQNGSMEHYRSGMPSPTIHFGEFSLKLPLKSLETGNDSKKLKHRDIFELWDAFKNWSSTEKDPSLRSPQQKHRDFILVNHSIQQHLCMAVASFSLTILAIPLAMKTQRVETSSHAIVAILLAFFYYFFIIIVNWLLVIPWLRVDLLLWIPNVLLCIIGSYLLHRREMGR